MTTTITRWVSGGKHVTTATEALKTSIEALESQANLQETKEAADFFYATIRELRLIVWDLESVNKSKNLVELSVELDAVDASRVHIHKAGCRDLRDEAVIGSFNTKEATLAELATWGTNFQTDIEMGLINFMPCVKGVK